MSELISIPQEYVQEANELVKKTGYPMDEVVAIFSKKMDEIKATGEVLKDPTKMAWKRTKSDLREDTRSIKNEDERYVFICGDSGLVDQLDNIRSKAKREMEKSFEDAVRQGLIDISGAVLDTRKTLYGRSPNPNFNQVLGESSHEWSREFTGLVSETQNFNEIEVATLRAYSDKAEEISSIKLWRTYAFKAPEKISKDPEAATAKVFNMAKGTRFTPLPNPIEPYEMLNKVQLLTIDEVTAIATKIFEENELVPEGKTKKRMPTVALQGYVENFYHKEGSDRASITLNESDDYDTSTIQCWMPGGIPLDLKKQWEIVVFGRPSKSKDKPVSISGTGYIVKATET